MRRPNTTLDIYLGASLPPASPDVSAQLGYLKDQFEQGSQCNDGSEQTFVYTSTLEVPAETNLPDGYPSGAFSTTVWVPDANGTCYTVVFTERERDFRGREFKRAYLKKGQDVALTVEEVDGSPSYASITTLRFDQADGFVVSQPSANVARIDISPATEFTYGNLSALDQAFLGTSSAVTNLYSSLKVVGDSAGTYFGSIYIGTGTKVLSAQIGSGPNSPKTYLHGSAGDLVLEVGTISDGGTQNAFIFGATGAITYNAFRVYVRTGSSAWSQCLTATVNGLSFTQGWYTGGSLSILSSAISDFTTAVQTIGDARYQPLDGDLTAIAALSGTNTIYYRSGTSTWSAVTIGTGLSFSGGTLSSTGTGTVSSVAVAAPAAGITVSGSPITTSGTITLTLADDLAALEGLSSNGMAARTGTSTWTTRTISAGNGISVTDGNGVSGNPTISTNPANQAEMEAGTENAKPVTPITMKFHPGVAKWWINFNGTGTIATRVSHNVTSITDNGTGDYTVTIADDFSSADWCPFFGGKYDEGIVTTCDSPQIGIVRRTSNPAAGSIRIGVVIDGGSTAFDALNVCAGGFGDQ